LNRLRLTASAIAATSLSSLGLAGVGTSTAHAASIAPNTGYNGRGFDTCTAPTDAQMDDWYAHSPYHAVGVYLGGVSYTGDATHPPLPCAAPPTDPTNHGGYTPAWVQHQSATGWAMWALYSGSQAKGLAGAGVDPTAVGVTEGTDAIAQAQNLGFAPGTIIFADMEGYNQASYTPNVVAYLKSFAATLAAGGYKTGLYGNSTAVGTTSTLGDAAADPALRSVLSAVDIANWSSPPATQSGQDTFHATTNNANLSPTLWSQHQRIHQYFGGHNETYGSTPLNIDSDQVDLAPAVPPGGVARYSGNDRIGTAVYTSQQLWPNAPATRGDYFSGGRPAARAAVLTRSDQYADALGGSALAAHVSGPLLLTGTATLSPATAAELVRTLAPGSTVYVLGGDKAVSPAVFNAVAALGFSPQRLAGNDRYETAVSIASQMAQDMKNDQGQPWVQRVLLATGANYPDALAAGTAAGATPDTILLLTNDRQIPAATAAYLAQTSGAPSGTGPGSATVYPVGGQADAAAASSAVPPINMHLGGLVGADRYQTATLVARQFFSNTGTPHTLGFATGLNFPDALSGGAAMATLGGPLLLTEKDAVPPATAQYLNAVKAIGSVEGGRVFGGPTVVTDRAVSELQAML
jgi:putative cell wall-binding protein